MKKLYLLAILMLGMFLFGGFNVSAKGNIEIKNISVEDKSGTITVDDLKYSNNTISSNISFNKLNDYVKLNIEVVNNTKNDYKLDSVINNINNEYIVVSSDNIGRTIKANSTDNIKVVLKYKNIMADHEDIHLTNKASIGLSFKQLTILSNPKTGKSIFIILFMIATIVGISVYTLKTRKAKALLLLLLLTPICVNAAANNVVTIKFNSDVTIKKVEVRMKLNPEYFFMTADESMDVLVEILHEWGRPDDKIQTEHIDDREGYTENQILSRFLMDFHYVAEEDMYYCFEEYMNNHPNLLDEEYDELYNMRNEVENEWNELMDYLYNVAEGRGNEGLKDKNVQDRANSYVASIYAFWDKIGLLDKQYGYSYIHEISGDEINDWYLDYNNLTRDDIDPNKTYYVNGYGDILEKHPNPHTYRMHFIKTYE